MAEGKSGNEVEHVEVAAVESSALEVMERAAIDVQIATAKKYPRSITKFLNTAKELVSIDVETAKSCLYSRPVGKEGGRMKYATGESIRLAEIVAATYGNMRVGGVITEMNKRYVKAMGFAHDLESNYAAKAEVVESTVNKNGIPYSERMRLVTAKAAQSKAIRDAIFRVVPKSVCSSLVAAAKTMALGKDMTMEKRRNILLQWIDEMKIEPDRVFHALNIDGIEEVGTDEFIVLTGIRTALKDSDITVAEVFPPLETEANGTGARALASKLASKKKTKPKPKAEPEPDKVTEFIDAEKQDRYGDEKKAAEDAKLKAAAETAKKKTDKMPEFICDDCDFQFNEVDIEIGDDGGQCPKCHSDNFKKNF